MEVVIPPPAFDLDTYQPFDDAVYQNTVDNILSDEVSFDGSFDEYSGGIVDDNNGISDGQYQGPKRLGKLLESEKRSDARQRLSGKKKSPYFMSGNGDKATKKAVATQRQIMMIESESDSNEPEPELDCAPAKKEGNATSLDAKYLGNGLEGDFFSQQDSLGESEAYGLPADEEDATAEPGLLGPLDTFLASHPFIKEGGYPVGRCARRQFMRDLRKEAGALGMDQASIDELARNTKTIYLETWAEGHTSHNDDSDGSEFGDEFDDEKERKSKKERKRKRHDSDKSKKKVKDGKRRNSCSEIDLPPIESKAKAVDMDQAMDTLLQSLPSATRKHRLHGDLVAISNPDYTNETYDINVENIEGAPEVFDATRNSPNKTERSGHSDLGSESDPIPIDDETIDNVHNSSPVRMADAQHATTVTETVPSVRSTQVNSKPPARGHLPQVDSGLRGQPIPSDDNDDGITTKTKEDASKKHACTSDVGNNELAKENHAIQAEPHETTSLERRKGRNRRRRRRRKQIQRAAKKQNPPQTELPSGTASGRHPEGRPKVSGQSVNRPAYTDPWKEPSRKHKALDDPFWDLDDF